MSNKESENLTPTNPILGNSKTLFKKGNLDREPIKIGPNSLFFPKVELQKNFNYDSLSGFSPSEASDVSSQQIFVNPFWKQAKSDEKQFNCADCGKGFATKICFKRHLRRHQDSKLFYCERCSRFYNMNIYNLHIDMHDHPLQHYKCKKCEKDFKTYRELIIHSRIHSGIFTYSCDKCDFKCHQRGNLTIHQKKKHS